MIQQTVRPERTAPVAKAETADTTNRFTDTRPSGSSMKLSWSSIPTKRYNQTQKRKPLVNWWNHVNSISISCIKQEGVNKWRDKMAYFLSHLWVGMVVCFAAKVALANCLHYVKWMVILIAVITVFLIENDSQA